MYWSVCSSATSRRASSYVGMSGYTRCTALRTVLPTPLKKDVSFDSVPKPLRSTKPVPVTSLSANVPVTSMRPSQNAGLAITVMNSWSSNVAFRCRSTPADGMRRRHCVGYSTNVRTDIHLLRPSSVRSVGCVRLPARSTTTARVSMRRPSRGSTSTAAVSSQPLSSWHAAQFHAYCIDGFTPSLSATDSADSPAFSSTSPALPADAAGESPPAPPSAGLAGSAASSASSSDAPPRVCILPPNSWSYQPEPETPWRRPPTVRPPDTRMRGTK
mmetsp:Transcript_16904/g.59106  ORF Transcript_16904/g.59106 Transcript_16904/m.59106 type:complete len:272 (+) Transcript_16904:1287-2102(+)